MLIRAVDAMMCIAEAMQSKYDITAGIFKPIPISEKNDHVNLKVNCTFYLPF